MEAIVLGVKNGRAALLLEDGTTTYRYMECRPGQRVEVPEKVGVVRSMPRAARTAAAAAALALVVSGGTLYATALPVSYVTEDVNPSMEYSLNRLDRVIGVTALNEDAETVVNDLAVSGGTIQEAVDASGKRMEAKGVLKKDGYVLFSVTSDSDRHAKKLENELTAMMDEKEQDGLTFSVLRVSEDEHREAKKLDMSAGRYKEMLNEKGKTAASDKRLISEFQNKSVREMLGGTDEAKKDAVQSVDRKKNATKQNVKKSEKRSKNTDSSTADTKREAGKEETKDVTQDQPTTQSSTQSKPAAPPADNPQPVAPTPAPESQQPQPQQNNGSGNEAPADPQPSETPQEVKKEEKQKESVEKAEPKKESEGSNKAEPEREAAEPPSDNFGSDDRPSGGGEPPGGGGGGPDGPP